MTDNRARLGDPWWPLDRDVFDAVAHSAEPLLIVDELDNPTAGVRLARAVHSGGPRNTRPFVHLVCDDMPADFLASELFGHDENRAAGRFRAKRGVAATASGGTLCLVNADRVPGLLETQLRRIVEETDMRVIAIVGHIMSSPDLLQSFVMIPLRPE